jgi:transcriptional regulator with XRE-family HTH domain
VAKSIGEVLRQARREAGLSARDLERLTGMSTASLSQIETGVRRDPGFRTVLRIARAIGISMEEIAQRMEGQTQGSSVQGKRYVSKTLALMTKAHETSIKSAAMLESAIAELRTPNKTVRIRKKK